MKDVNNGIIADQFSLLSKLMEIHGEQAFRAKSYAIAAYNVEQLPRQAADMTDEELYAAKGIGASIGKKIREIQRTGMLPALQQLIDQTPPGILDILQIKGLGPKKIALIWKELEIEDLGALEYACLENRLAGIKGFGQKTQQSVLESIQFIKQSAGYLLWADADQLVNKIVNQLKSLFPTYTLWASGAYRRQMPVVDKLEFVTNQPLSELEAYWRQAEGSDLQIDGSALSVRTTGWPQLIFHTTDSKHLAVTLVRTTGSAEFVAALGTLLEATNTGDDEAALFARMGLPEIPPPLREKDTIVASARQNGIPPVIKPADICGIIHSHSTWSDGAHSLETMSKAARDQGYAYLVISDHSQAAFYAHGLSPERIREQHLEIDALNEKLAPFKIFKSIEADILNDGCLDYEPAILETFDLVIASVHSNLRMSQEKAMDRLLTAIANPYTTILGHATGRLLLSREGYPLDHRVIIDACFAHQVVIEINAHPRRLDLDWEWIPYALERGVLLSINPDAHAVEGFADVRYGVMAAQKGGLTAQHNLSSYSREQFEDFLARYRRKRNPTLSH